MGIHHLFVLHVKRFVAILALLVVATGTAFAEDGETIRIGMTVSSTGNYALAAQSGQQGFGLWLDDVNARGGILHNGERYPVELVIRDDRSDKQLIPRLYEELITEDDVDLVLSPFGSTLSGAAAAVVDRYGMFMATWSAASDAIFQQGYTTVVNVSVTPTSRQPEVPMSLLKSLGGSKVGIIHVDEPYGEALAGFAVETADRLDLEVVSNETYAKGARDFTVLLQKAQLAGAELYLIFSYENDIITMLRQMKEQDINFPAIYTTYSQNPSVLALGSDAEGMWGQAAFDPRAAWPVTDGMNAQEFLDAFAQAYPDVAFPDINVQVAYAAGAALERIVADSASLETADLRASAAALSGEMTTLVGPYSIDQTGQQVGLSILVLQNTPEGQEVVAPESVATAPAIYPARTWEDRDG